jgi:hypothetical protein
MLFGCYEARKEASYWTGYGSDERTRIETNHTTEEQETLTNAKWLSTRKNNMLSMHESIKSVRSASVIWYVVSFR